MVVHRALLLQLGGVGWSVWRTRIARGSCELFGGVGLCAFKIFLMYEHKTPRGYWQCRLLCS